MKQTQTNIQTKKIRLFVYGTLCRGLSRNNLLSQAKFIDLAYCEGGLIDVGSYPGLVRGEGYVVGEVYEIDSDTLSRLDMVEGFYEDDIKHSLFTRKMASICSFRDNSTTTTWLYYFKQDDGNYHRIQDEQSPFADYRRYLTSQKDEVTYLAYGSNMNLERLVSRIGEPLSKSPAYLNGYKVVFNKANSLIEPTESFANIQAAGSPEDQCRLVAYRLMSNQLLDLDLFEGTPNHYIRVGMAYRLDDSKQRVGQVYIANPKMVKEGLQPSQNYLQLIGSTSNNRQ